MPEWSNDPGVRWAAAVLCAAAGFFVFVAVLNRWLLGSSARRLKNVVNAGAMLLICAGGFAAGWHAPVPAATVAAALVLPALAAGEVRRLAIRRRCRGSAPVQVRPEMVRLRRPVTTLDLRVVRYRIPLPAGDRPFRVVHFSDLHANRAIPLSYYREVFRAAEESRPDVALLTGDFVTWKRDVPLLAGILRPIGRLATFAVLGNHDHWVADAPVSAAVRDAGITLLGGVSQTIALSPHASVRFSGCEAPWGPCIADRGPDGEGQSFLVLTHTADNIYRLSRMGAHAVFAGHFHAGQFRLPWLGPVAVPSAYGRRFDHGHFVVDGTHLFVTAGVGVAIPPLRLYCRPDIFVVDFVAGTD